MRGRPRPTPTPSPAVHRRASRASVLSAPPQCHPELARGSHYVHTLFAASPGLLGSSVTLTCPNLAAAPPPCSLPHLALPPYAIAIAGRPAAMALAPAYISCRYPLVGTALMVHTMAGLQPDRAAHLLQHLLRPWVLNLRSFSCPRRAHRWAVGLRGCTIPVTL